MNYVGKIEFYHQTMAPYYIDLHFECLQCTSACQRPTPMHLIGLQVYRILAQNLLFFHLFFRPSKSQSNVVQHQTVLSATLKIYLQVFVGVFTILMSALHDHSQQDLGFSIFILLMGSTYVFLPLFQVSSFLFSFRYFFSSPWFALLGLSLLLSTIHRLG